MIAARGRSARTTARAETETNGRVKCGPAPAPCTARDRDRQQDGDNRRRHTTNHDHETCEAEAPLVDDRIVVTRASERADPLASDPVVSPFRPGELRSHGTIRCTRYSSRAPIDRSTDRPTGRRDN